MQMSRGTSTGYRIVAGMLVLIFLSLQCSAGQETERNTLSRADVFFSEFTDARMAACAKPCLFLRVKQHYLLKNFNDYFLLAAFPVKRGVMAVSARDAGLTAMKEQQLSLHYGMKLLPELDAGIRLLWDREVFQDAWYPQKNRYSFSVSVQTTLKQQLQLGFSMDHPLVYPKGDGASGPLARIRIYGEKSLGSGASLQISLEQQKGSGISAQMGVSIRKNKVLLSAGMQIHPGSVYFSTGWCIRRLVISVKAAWHPVLGYSPESLIYAEKGGNQ